MAIFELDHQLTTYIHHLPHNILFDEIALFFSLKGIHAISWVIIFLLLTYFSYKERFMVFFSSLTSGFFAYFLAGTIKLIIQRSRPLYGSLRHNVNLLYDYPSDFSFPSIHAAGAFALAVTMSYYHRKYAAGFLLLAFLVGFSRIYLGYHYVIDVLAGAIIGCFVSILLIIYEKKCTRSVKRERAAKSR